MFNIKPQPVLAADYHHPLSASQLKRISYCAGSVEACEGIKTETNEAAKFGSLVHEYAYKLYQGLQVIGEHKALAVAEKYIAQLKNLVGPDLSVGVMEHRLFLEEVVSKKYGVLTGTVDYAAYIPFDRLLVADLKTGMGDIQPMDNWQLMFYAAAAFYNLDPFCRAAVTKISLVIIQINERVGTEVKIHTITEKDLERFVIELKAIVDRVDHAGNELTPGEHCHQTYCAARFTCPAYKAYINEHVGGELIELGATDVPVAIDFSRWLQVIPAIKDRIKQIEEMALKVALDNPDAVPGWTVTQSFGHRKWEDACHAADQLENELGKAIWIEELITPAQAEKLLGKGKKKLMPATVRSDNGYKLVKKKKDEIDKFLEGIEND